jgi:class 3 adenylate cyclase/tetratricopeptide (TPR) repeat protein
MSIMAGDQPKTTCSLCGAENTAESRFCRACGSILEVARRSETRRVVTVSFTDLAESTQLGTRLDAEAVRRLMTRYFEEMGAIVRRYGGTTEKFIGDAIMAVFGVPQLHEDDAERAVRAAVAMGHALATLNEELRVRWGVKIATRTGINTGEVIAGDASQGESFVVGDAVNVAARLQQSAAPGEILIGATTYRLVRDAITAATMRTVEVKGKTEAVESWSVLEITPEPIVARRLESPLIGREEELAAVEAALARARDGSCRLLTVMGPAGVGKSRLIRELLLRLGAQTRVLVGRCLPYGEGITFWPVVEIIRAVTGISGTESPDDARAKIALGVEGADADLVSSRLAALLGLAEAVPVVEETFWAIRKLLAGLAAREPIIVVFDDVHWAEGTFLDLLEYLADSLRDAPVLLICLARPELLEQRGNWMAGKPNASRVHLGSLTDVQMDRLIRNFVGGATVAEEVRARIGDASEGNPLFVEETLRMLVDDGILRPGAGAWTITGDLAELTIPPTINALLTARLDRLTHPERAVVERAAVIGRVFWWGAVAAMSPQNERATVANHLQSLTRKELIRPDQSALADEDAFRFAHVLMRDAAYAGIPKADRAQLHEQFAAWLESKHGERSAEYDEIIGYHLEQAYRALGDLGPFTRDVEDVGRRAAASLAAAGRRAFARGDMPAAAALLSRAVDLVPESNELRLELLPELGHALLETADLVRARAVLDEARREAASSQDERLRARVLILDQWVRVYTDPEGWAGPAEEDARRAMSIFEALGDERGLAESWSLLGLVYLFTCAFGAAEEAWEKAAACAEAGGDRREQLEALAWVPLVVWAGSRPVDEAIERCHDVSRRARGDRKALSAALFSAANLEGMRGNYDEARRLIADARSMLEEVGLEVWLAGPMAEMSGLIELWAGDLGAAERELASGVETLRRIGEFAWLPTLAGLLAEVLYEQGRDEEAEDALRSAEETAGSEDAYAQGLLRIVKAKILARAGQANVAEALARRAVDIVETTDFPFLHTFVLTGLAEVMRRNGLEAEADEALARAIEAAERKGFLVGVERARAVSAPPASSPMNPR